MTSTQASELGPYKPVADALVLAAMDRAQRNNPTGYDEGVIWSDLAEHLGFIHAPATTARLRPQVSRLKAERLIERKKVRGYTVWRLTSEGRKRLTKARRAREILKLPEAPQHRRWRQARVAATKRLDELRGQLRHTLSEASNLLDSEDGGSSGAWYELTKRLTTQIECVASATYCAREWDEPDDRRADANRDGRRRSYWETVSKQETPTP